MKNRSLIFVVALVSCGKPATKAALGMSQTGDPSDQPINGVHSDQLALFNKGDDLFSAPLMEADGLGPLFTRTACSDCHNEGKRGPAGVRKMVVVEADGKTPAADQSKLIWGHTVRPLTGGGATTPILPPTDDPSVRVSLRTGPPIFGRGFMEAVADSEIERMAQEQSTRSDGIHGRVNHVIFNSVPNPDTTFNDFHTGDLLIGRFGDKARIASLDEFAADALQGDMGITSPMRPTELPNPDGLTDDAKPGVDVGMDSINLRAMYVRLNAVPKRADNPAGAKLFAAANCSVCHAPALHTRSDYPIAQLSGTTAAVYTDMLLHDLGDGLADSMVDIDGEAGPRDWRTAPLVGVRFATTFLHDSRAHSVRDAIGAHASPGSEANESVDRFNALSASEQQALIDFVSGL